eukprot:12789027-Alexandrium_andersonii.AAC.1
MLVSSGLSTCSKPSHPTWQGDTRPEKPGRVTSTAHGSGPHTWQGGAWPEAWRSKHARRELLAMW